MLNYMKEVFNVYKQQPKFLFGFHGELSHDSYNDIGVVDEDLRNWLRDLHEFGHLNNTVLILMSDHGHRFVYRHYARLNFQTTINASRELTKEILRPKVRRNS